MASESWREAYHGLLVAVKERGFPEEFGKLIARNLGSEKMMRRMTGYLKAAKPRSMEETADEMLAILSDRDRWIEKKELERTNAKYNAYLDTRDEDGPEAAFDEDDDEESDPSPLARK